MRSRKQPLPVLRDDLTERIVLSDCAAYKTDVSGSLGLHKKTVNESFVILYSPITKRARVSPKLPSRQFWAVCKQGSPKTGQPFVVARRWDDQLRRWPWKQSILTQRSFCLSFVVHWQFIPHSHFGYLMFHARHGKRPFLNFLLSNCHQTSKLPMFHYLVTYWYTDYL